MLQSMHWPVHGFVLVQCCSSGHSWSELHPGSMHVWLQHICMPLHSASCGQFSQFSPGSISPLPHVSGCWHSVVWYVLLQQ